MISRPRRPERLERRLARVARELGVLRESAQRVEGDAVNASGRALEPSALGQPCQHGVGESGVSSLFGSYEAIVLFGELDKLFKTRAWHSPYCGMLPIGAATAFLSISFHYGTILTDAGACDSVFPLEHRELAECSPFHPVESLPAVLPVSRSGQRDSSSAT